MKKAGAPIPRMSEEGLQLVAARFRLLADPMRLRILQLLEGGEQSVSAIAGEVGSTQPNVSKHLKLLQEAGLLARRQEGNTVYYSIADPHIFALCSLVCSNLQERNTRKISLFATPDQG